MIIAVDFDGTIVRHNYPEIGREIPFAVETLKAFVAEGHKVILWTSRYDKNLEDALQWCKDRGLSFYAVNSNYPESSIVPEDKRRKSPKVVADVYIDDRNLGGIPDWGMIYQIVTGHKYTWKVGRLKRCRLEIAGFFSRLFR